MCTGTKNLVKYIEQKF